MSVAVCLLIYSVAVAVLCPAPLARLTASGTAPRLGAAAWLAAMISVPLSWLVAAIYAGRAVLAQGPRGAVSSCVGALHGVALGRYGVASQVVLLLVTLVAAATVGVLAVRLARLLVRARRQTHRHAAVARMIGERVTRLRLRPDAVVLDCPERAAYCVAGRPNTIVVTTAALEVLDEPQLSAVLAHEGAHLAGRHHPILAFTRALAAVLPRLAVCTRGATEVARLLEMCADDAAARRTSGPIVASALLALAERPTTPAAALGATGLDVVGRTDRLLSPPRRVNRAMARLTTSGAVAMLAGGPALITLLALSGATFCSPIS